MSKGNGAFGAIGKVITYILVVLLVLGIAGMIAYFALRAQGVTYYVEYGGERYIANGDGGSIELLSGMTSNFAVKSLTGDEVNYSVTVQSNYSNNFDFVIDGEYRQFYSTTEENNDYSAVFGLQKRSDGFSVTLPDHFTVEQAVEKQYGGDIGLQNELSDDLCYFVITVISDESIVSLWFTFFDFTVTLDPPQIVFER